MSRSIFVSLTLLSIWGCGDGGDRATPEGEGDGVTCASYAAHVSEVCGQSESDLVAACENDRDRYEPIGCGVELASYYQCFATREFDCDTGEGCPGSETYGRCVSMFAATTNCTRQQQNDDACEPNEYAFNCLAELPAGCTKQASSTLGSLACCASFAKGASPFE